MKKRFIQPAGSPRTPNYHHVVTVEGGRVIYTAGQVAFDRERNIVGGEDLAAQTRQALKNLQTAVEAAGGRLSDIVKLTTYVVGYQQEQLSTLMGVVREVFPTHQLPANTLIGVQALAVEGLLVEIEGTAVTDAPMP